VARADALQEHLQRAAATGGTDQTAARALELLNDFQSEHVGTDRAWTKPLYVAREKQIAAKRDLDEANRAHKVYLDKVKSVQQLKVGVEEIEKRCRLLKAANAVRFADQSELAAERARSLIAELKGDPIDANALQAAMDQVGQAIAVWKSAPALAPRIGRTSAEVDRELAAIPRPSGKDLIPDQSIVEAEQAWLVARMALTAHEGQRPEGVPTPRASIPLLVAAGVAVGAGIAIGFLTTHIVTILALVIAAGLVLYAVLNTTFCKLRTRAAEQTWNMTRTEHQRALQSKEAKLRTALMQRGVADIDDIGRAIRVYREGCEKHAIIAALEREREHALLVEANRTNRNDAAEKLMQAARAQGLEAADPQSALAALTNWQEINHERLAQAQRRAGADGELKSLLDGRTPEQFVQEIKLARQNAETLIGDLPRAQVEDEANTPGLEGRLTEAQSTASQAREDRANAKGELRALVAPDVSASEEALAVAQAELDRILRLDATLNTARKFLENAQDRVHREFAPHLEKALRDWLPRITNNRYMDASVDPISLNVKVKDNGGTFRDARLLSQGTREQIYLLLRMALVAFLTKPGEVSPLIFDDVTVQTDGNRTEAVLNLLHEISGARQVIVFSQEEDVSRWAERHLVGEERDKIIRFNGSV
jgi:DNA repair exonuclease SbcCD ATPase subunit